jgi:hypothetical protein
MDTWPPAAISNAKSPRNSCHKVRVPIRFRGMNQEKLGFIDHSIIVGFINDFEIK